MSAPGFDWSGLEPEDVSDAADFLGPEEVSDTSFTEEYVEPDPAFVKAVPRSIKARGYEKKVRGPLVKLTKVAVQQPATVADGAALIMHGPKFAEKLGDLAAESEFTAKAIDWLTEGSDNAAFALVVASLPLFTQLVRNHEPVLEPSVRGIRIPFTKRFIKVKLGVRLGKWRAMTNDPEQLTYRVFRNKEIRAALEKQGIPVAPYPARRTR